MKKLPAKTDMQYDELAEHVSKLVGFEITRGDARYVWTDMGRKVRRGRARKGKAVRNRERLGPDILRCLNRIAYHQKKILEEVTKLVNGELD